MPRTRNFVLFLFAGMFLVWGIGITISRDFSVGARESTASALFATTETPETGAVLPETSEETREERLATLREKIATRFAGLIPAPAQTTAVVSSEGAADNEVELAPASEDTAPQSACPEPMIVPGRGLAGVDFKEIIGQRIFYRTLAPIALSEMSTSSTSTAPLLPTEEVVLALPLRTQPLLTTSCIVSDVVGIALDGSYIRNNEHLVYSVFGPDTLVGYALDGFPIYGKNDSLKTDSCGGTMVAGTYRYYLSGTRESVLQCYSGIPIRL